MSTGELIILVVLIGLPFTLFEQVLQMRTIILERKEFSLCKLIGETLRYHASFHNTKATKLFRYSRKHNHIHLFRVVV